MMQSFGQTLAYIDGAGTLYNTFTTAKSILTSATTVAGVSSGAVILPGGFLRRGTQLIIDAQVGLSAVASSANVFTWEVRLGPTSTIVVNGTMSHKVTTTANTTISHWLHLEGTVRSEGTGTLATMIWFGRISGRMIVPNGATAGADYSAGSGDTTLPDGVPAVGTGFDSTVANTLDLFCGMSSSNAANGVQIQQYRVWSPNLAGA